MSIQSSKENNKFINSDDEDNELSDINYYNQYNTQSCTNKCNIYKSDSDSLDPNTIEDFIKKEFVDKKNKSDIEENIEENSSEMDLYEIKRDNKNVPKGHYTGLEKIFEITKTPKIDKLNNYLFINKKLNKEEGHHGDWGLGIGDWGLGPIPNPQSPIPNPQSPIPNYDLLFFFIFFL